MKLSRDVHKSWDLEAIGTDLDEPYQDDVMVREHYDNTAKHRDEKREVGQHWKLSAPVLACI